MKNARSKISIASALALTSYLAVAVFSHNEVMAAAGGIQNCTVGVACTVGEFLYDDNSVALTGATCTLTSKYPDGSDHLTGQSMTGQSDGWYAYEFTAPATTGVYRAVVSCTTSGDTVSIDKTFQVNAASSTDPDAVASAVWGSSSRTLTSFGSLTSDIWNYSGRTVTSFGSLIADIWASATRTLTGASLSSGNLATQSDTDSVKTKVDGISVNSTNVTNVTNNVSEIKTLTEETRFLIEEVVNKPIIQNVLEESVPDLGGKLQNTRAAANQIYVNTQYLTSQSATLGASWNTKNGKDLLASVIELSSILGEEGDSSSSDTVFGQANYIRDSWNWDEAENIYLELTSAKKITEDLKEGLADYEKDPALYSQAKALVKSFMALEKVVGGTTDTSAKKTLFARIKSTESLALSLDQKEGEVNKVLGAFVKSKDASIAASKAKDLKNQVIALNKVPGVLSALSRINSSDPTSIKNALLGLRGVIDSNKKLLSLGAGKTLINTWLEIGSVVFKTVATNPSKLISQEVDVKYYLPQEIKKDDVIKTDAGLSVEYDSEKDQLYVTGIFTLAAGQTRTFSVETKDIWEYSQTRLDSFRAEADELFKPLEKTAYFAQGISLKSDINANLDKMSQIQAEAVTPEDKIRAYRECKILKDQVDGKIAGMRDLVTQASAAGNLFGFVGGAQTIAVWGLIVVIAAGFIFMTIYMKIITTKAKKETGQVEENSEVKRPRGISLAKLITIMIASSVASATITGVLVSKLIVRGYEEKIKVLGEQTIKTETEFVNDAETQLEETKKEALVEEEDSGVGGPYLVTISETPTGYLRVREAPEGREIGKVYPGDKLLFLDENDKWYQVELESGEIGWVSKEYSTKE